MFAGRKNEALLHIGVVEQSQIMQYRGYGFARTFRQRIAMAVVIIQAIADDRLRHGNATVAAHWLCHIGNSDRQVDARRNRQTAMITIKEGQIGQAAKISMNHVFAKKIAHINGLQHNMPALR